MQKQLNRQLITLWRGGYLTLDPKPPLDLLGADASQEPKLGNPSDNPTVKNRDEPAAGLTLDLGQKQPASATATAQQIAGKGKTSPAVKDPEKPVYKPRLAEPTEKMNDLLKLRGVHPLYAVFLMNHLGIADKNERIMAFESILELSRSLGKAIRIPPPDILPPGPLATTRLDAQLLTLGLATAEEIGAIRKDEQEEPRGWQSEEDFVPILTLPYKLNRLFLYDFPGVDDVRVTPVWVAGEAIQYGTDFNKYITSNKLQKQEGVIFRHLLRLVLLLDEMAELCPPDVEHADWRDDLAEIANQLEEICRLADPRSTDQWLAESRQTERDL